MPLDPQLLPLVQLMSANPTPLADQSVDDVRQGYAGLSMLLGEPEAVADVTDHVLEAGGGDVALRVYTPEGDGPHPGLLYLHGGGFVIGDLDSHDHVCRELTNRVGCVTVSADYRRGPEVPYPAAVEDAWAALEWLATTEEATVDRDRLAVAGDSAGGNLAAVLALRSRDRGGPTLRMQALVYPVTDQREGATTPSRVRNAEGYVLTAEMMEWFAGHYFADRALAEEVDASPALADLAGLAPAVVATAEFDPLHDEGVAYHEALLAAGGRSQLLDYDGAIHLAFQLGPVTDVGRRMVDDVARALAEALHG